MKIFAVMGAYDSGAAAEEGVWLPEAGQPVWYEIPDSSISRSGNPFFVPDEDGVFAAFPSVAYRVCKLGRSVAERFAPRYYDEATIGFSVVDMRRLAALRAASMPWTAAVAFDRSCLLGNFMPISAFINYADFSLTCGEASLKYQPNRIKVGIDRVVSLLSADNTIKTGDIILGALSRCGIRLMPGSRLRVDAADLNVFDINVK